MRKSLLLATAALLAAGTIHAQRLQDGYVTWPESSKLPDYVSAWNGGNGTISVDGVAFEDHNFFISRVKPRTRISNTNTQIRTSLVPTTIENGTVTPGTDKRLIFWVPISNELKGSQRLNALADGIFDGEMFSLWSYIDVYGNWNSPYGWTPGNFADVCHKNGVAVHGVASVPFGGIHSTWRACFENLCALNNTAVAKFLYFHGQDGLGYNSEWDGYAPSKLIALHNDLQTYMATRNPIWEVMWYGGTTESGGRAFDTGVSSSNYPNLYKSSSVFLNYNWNSTGTMSSSINYSKSTIKKDPFYIYAGLNMQGGEPKSGDNYNLLKDYAYSIGLWGAHSINMLWNERFANGGSELAKQQTYQKCVEQWFGNGPRNPAIQLTPTLNRNHRPSDTWAGMSSMMSERSTINHVIKDESFVTFFNIGNGFFFNWRGERQNSNPWHNIGVQDFMPTWRFWFAPQFCQKNVTAGTTSLDADFIWEDAYMGGSCLRITGSAEQEYLHLFRASIVPGDKNKIVIRYKLLNGEADIRLVTSSGSDPATIGKIVGQILTVDESADVCDESYADGADGWVTKVFNITTNMARNYSAAKGGVGIIGLEFKNAKNMELLLGEFGWYPGTQTEALETNITKRTTPQAPIIKTSKVLAYNHSGADIKFTWDMANTAAAGEPVYNADVNTSVFRMYAQQEGFEPHNMGITTSWAGICFSVPVDGEAPSTRVRVGVSAVSADYLTESAITWTDYITLPAYQGTDEITCSKSILKANEKFNLSFVDPLHASATWTITNSAGSTVWTGSGFEVTCPGLPAVDQYTVTETHNGTTKTYRNYITVSPDETGALPEIYSLALNNATVADYTDDAEFDTYAGTDAAEPVTIRVNEPRTFSYTGRDADGMASRGIEFQGRWVGVNVGSLGIQANKSFSVAAWVKFPAFNGSLSSFMTIENRAGSWPYNNWDFFWSRLNNQGQFIADQIDTAWGGRVGSGTEGSRLFYRYDDARIPENTWTHVVIVFEYSGNSLREKLYINGVLQTVGCYIRVHKGNAEGILGSEDGLWSQLERCQSLAENGVYGTNTTEPAYCPSTYPLESSHWIAFGGSASKIASLDGYIDEFQVWGKAMTDDDVLKSMNGLDSNNLPADILGFWDFESAPASDYGFTGHTGSNATYKSPKCYFWREAATGNEGQGGKVFLNPVFNAGSPSIKGNYAINTTPVWNTGRSATINGSGTGTSGSYTISWAKPRDYEVELTLSNPHGTDTRKYPVISVVDELAGIGSIGADSDDFNTYVESNTVFVEFASDGLYNVEVYNASGMQVGLCRQQFTAGQNAQINLSQAGVYFVKVVKDGTLLRTVKVLVK